MNELELLGLTLKQAKKIVAKKPNETEYYHIDIQRYYKNGARKNAMVFDSDSKVWGHATRSNLDLVSHKSFIPISTIERALKENKPD